MHSTLVRTARSGLLITALLPLSLAAQAPGSTPPPTTPLPSTQPPVKGLQQPAPAPTDAAAEAEIRTLIEQLGAPEFARREAAEQRLGELGAAAQRQLEQAAQATDDAEIRFRARRLLAAPQGGGDGKLQPRRPDAAPVPAERDEARDEDMLRRFDRMFDGAPGGPGDLTEMHERMREMLRRGPLRDWGTPGLDLDRGGIGQGSSVQIGPDGVRVEVRGTGEDGKSETLVYEAPDLETFRREHPQIAERYLGQGGGLRILNGPIELRGGFRGLAPRGIDPGDQQAAPGLRWPMPQGSPVGGEVPPDGERLSVMVLPVPPALVDYLALEPGHGLLVGEVLDGGLGAALGLAPQDLLIELGGRKVRSTEDIRAALRAMDAGDEVVATVLRRGRETRLTAPKPAVDEAGAGSGRDAQDQPVRGRLQPRRR